jgi:hypothetical protein
MQVRLRRKDTGLQFAPFLIGRASYSRGEWFSLNSDTDAVGLVRRFEGLLKGIPRYLANQIEELEAAQAQVPRLEKLTIASAFAKQGQLDEVLARMRQLEKELQPSRNKDGEKVERNPMNSEWDKLEETEKRAMRLIASHVQKHGQHISVPYGSGDVYAYPRGEGIAWGVNGSKAGFNSARGVLSGRELEAELGQSESTIAHPTGAADHVIFELQRQLAASAGETPPRGEVIGDAWEAGLPQMNSGTLHGEQNGNKYPSLPAAVARLEPHEFACLEKLTQARDNEEAFDRAFNELKTMGDADIERIAHAYTGEDGRAPGRDASLGAIETTFYGAKSNGRRREQGGR